VQREPMNPALRAHYWCAAAQEREGQQRKVWPPRHQRSDAARALPQVPPRHHRADAERSCARTTGVQRRKRARGMRAWCPRGPHRHHYTHRASEAPHAGGEARRAAEAGAGRGIQRRHVDRPGVEARLQRHLLALRHLHRHTVRSHPWFQAQQHYRARIRKVEDRVTVTQ